MSLLDLTLSAAHQLLSMAGHLLAAAADPSATPGGGGGSALPDSEPLAPPGLAEIFARVVGVVKWFGLGACVISLIIWAMMVAWSSHRGRGEDLAGGFGRVLLGVGVISGAVSLISFILG